MKTDNSMNTLSNYDHNQQQQQQHAPAMALEPFHHPQMSSLSWSSSDDCSSNSYNMEAVGKRQLFLRSYQFSRRKPSLLEKIKKSSFIRAVKRLIKRLLRQLRTKSRTYTNTWKMSPRLLCRFNLVRSSSSSDRVNFHRLAEFN